MPVTVSYPGLYIDEITSNARSIEAAPTSITVFVGYSNPLNTATFAKPIRILSFADYERLFGGIFISDVVQPDLPHAVRQFFQNGGSDAYVVGLKARYLLEDDTSQDITGAEADLVASGTTGITFTARELTDRADTAMTVKVENKRAAEAAGDVDTADITIIYGRRIETLRGVALTRTDLTDYVNNASQLIKIAPRAGGYGTKFDNIDPETLTLTTTPPATLETTFAASDFTAIFQADGLLDKVEVFNLLLTPGINDLTVLSAALAFAERKQAFFIMDAPANVDADGTMLSKDIQTYFGSGGVPLSQNGAIYFPWLKTTNPLDDSDMAMAPSGFVAGIYAKTDMRRGVWKAPAGYETTLLGTTGVVDTGVMTNLRQGILNKDGINCLRQFSGIGTIVFGARTLVAGNPAFQQNKYVSVRRMTLFIEQTLLANLKWVVFEPNAEPLWLAIRTTIENFLLSLLKQQALQGSKPSEAFDVRCGYDTTTQDDINNGIVNIVVAFAPLKPAEFVVIKIAHLAGQTQS
jgi:phage tail sheath protein FI